MKYVTFTLWILYTQVHICIDKARISSNEGTLLDYTMWQSEHDGGHPEV